MSRGNSKTPKHTLEPDARYGSVLVSKLINYIMKNGKKTVAERIVYNAFDRAAKELKAEPMDIFAAVLKNVGPAVEVKGKRVAGANYQVPVEVNKDRKVVLAFRWIVNAASSRKGAAMYVKLSDELIQAYNNEGAAIKKRDEVHRMAEANKAFAHFARF
ncbi:MAG: 30S ribosomal protein S7 [bacterium ADurb.Bin212]|nr:MAG: 30S ribosomal protein S7 [bacterium ADurb.Bin212]